MDNPKPVIAITAEDAEYAEDAEKEELHWQPVRWDAFTPSVTCGSSRVCHANPLSAFSVSSVSSAALAIAVFQA